MSQSTYPKTKVHTTTQTFHGETIDDNYSWLEKRDQDVGIWIDRQSEYSEQLLKKVRARYNAREKIEALSSDYRRPIKYGPYYLTLIRYKFSAPSVYISKSPINYDQKKILDPSWISKDAKFEYRDFEISGDQKKFAFSYSMDGSDWCTIRVVTTSGKLLDDRVDNVKFSSIIWKGQGFYYMKRVKDEFESPVQNAQIYYHELGQPSSEDKKILARGNKVTREFFMYKSSDGRFLIIKEKIESRGKFNYFYVDFDSSDKLTPLLMNSDKNIIVIDSYNEKLLCRSTNEEGRTILFYIDIHQPNQWEVITICPEDFVNVGTTALQDEIMVEYLSDARQYLVFYDLEGNIVHKKAFDWGMTLSGVYASKYDLQMTYFTESYAIPPILYSMDTRSYESEILYSATVPYKYYNYQIYPTQFQADDGEDITILLMHKKDLELDGSAPCLLEVYGGYGSIHNPQYNRNAIMFVREGGVYAYALVRGGGEKGKEWHKAGMNMHRKRGINDFVQAAEHLINKGYTNSDKLAISGASHGGLMVAAAMLSKPSLFKAVVPVVGVFDMLNFEKHTVGVFHRDEYGSVENEEEFRNLRSYSPYHNIKEETNYPAMLIMTAENDDRVPPFHSYKFAAALQNNPGQINPILLRVAKEAGHYGGTTYDREMTERGDKMGFILHHLKN